MASRVLLLDLDGTLLDYPDDAWLESIRVTCEGLAARVPTLDAARLAEVYARICLDYWQVASAAVMLAPSGSASGHDVWREHWHEALALCGHDDDALARRALHLYRRDRLGRYRLYSDVRGALHRLRRVFDRIAVVTNGPGDTQREKIAAVGLDRYLDGVIASGEVGHAKPGPAIFRAALREFGAEPADAWHVGDSLTSDVAGARNAGLAAAVWLDRTGQTAPPDAGPAAAVWLDRAGQTGASDAGMPAAARLDRTGPSTTSPPYAATHRIESLAALLALTS